MPFTHIINTLPYIYSGIIISYLPKKSLFTLVHSSRHFIYDLVYQSMEPQVVWRLLCYFRFLGMVFIVNCCHSSLRKKIQYILDECLWDVSHEPFTSSSSFIWFTAMIMTQNIQAIFVWSHVFNGCFCKMLIGWFFGMEGKLAWKASGE